MAKIVDWDDHIGRRLRLRDLRVFFMVVQHGSLAKAAAQLRVSQPAVSQVIADLEHSLGARLFDRGTRGVEPTIYARALLSRGRAAFDELRQGIRDIEFLTDPTAGEVRIASLESLNSFFLPAVIDRLRRKFPRLAFHVLSIPTPTSRHLEVLRERTVDLAVTYLAPPFEHDDLTAEFLYPEALIVAAAPDSQWARRRKVELAELVDEPWCLPMKGSPFAPAIAQAFRERDLAPPWNFVSTDSAQLRLELTTTGHALSFAFRSRLRLSGKRWVLKAVPVDLHIPLDSVGIVTLKNRTINPPAQLFIECARQLAKQLAAA
jgi:DNA-binding transcriptional LysR family regulator